MSHAGHKLGQLSPWPDSHGVWGFLQAECSVLTPRGGWKLVATLGPNPGPFSHKPLLGTCIGSQARANRPLGVSHCPVPPPRGLRDCLTACPQGGTRASSQTSECCGLWVLGLGAIHLLLPHPAPFTAPQGCQITPKTPALPRLQCKASSKAGWGTPEALRASQCTNRASENPFLTQPFSLTCGHGIKGMNQSQTLAQAGQQRG